MGDGVPVSGGFWRSRSVLDPACSGRQARCIVVYGDTTEMPVVWPGRGVMVLGARGSADMRME